VESALADHELIKVRIGRGFAGDRKRAAQDLAAATDAHLAQVIGRIAVLYRRRRRDDPERPRIELPP
jgi:RNA-binding protein